MGVKIKIVVEPGSIGMFQLNSQLMEVCHFWEYVFVEFVELSVEILSAEAGPEISCNHSIRIKHRHNVENKRFSESNSGWVF